MCDDGNSSDLDGCVSGCVTAICGDGFVRAGIEDCDDGNDVDTDACRADCTPALCGDGVARTDIAEGDDGFESCDDANNVNTDGCRNNCVLATCGDGIVRDDLSEGESDFEACDDGDANTNAALEACSTDCVPVTCETLDGRDARCPDAITPGAGCSCSGFGGLDALWLVGLLGLRRRNRGQLD